LFCRFGFGGPLIEKGPCLPVVFALFAGGWDWFAFHFLLPFFSFLVNDLVMLLPPRKIRQPGMIAKMIAIMTFMFQYHFLELLASLSFLQVTECAWVS
jgi:hypothetical protein